MKIINKIGCLGIILLAACSGDPIDLPPQIECATGGASSVTVSSSNTGGNGGMNNTSSSGTICVPKNCDTLSVELSAGLTDIHTACGYVPDGCNGYVNCGTCTNIRENCETGVPISTMELAVGTTNLCNGGCTVLPGSSLCLSTGGVLVLCTDKTPNQPFVDPEGWPGCVLLYTGMIIPNTDGVRIIRWCC